MHILTFLIRALQYFPARGKGVKLKGKLNWLNLYNQTLNLYQPVTNLTYFLNLSSSFGYALKEIMRSDVKCNSFRFHIYAYNITFTFCENTNMFWKESRPLIVCRLKNLNLSSGCNKILFITFTT